MKFRNFKTAAIIVSTFAAAAFSQVTGDGTATVTGTADATIARHQITLEEIVSLDFGTITVSNTGATVVMGAVITPDDGVTQTIVAGDMGGSVSNYEIPAVPDQYAAEYDVTAVLGVDYTITLPTSVTLTGTPAVFGDPAPTIVVDNFTTADPALTRTGTGAAADIVIGATLNVIAGQETGAYTGSMDVVVDYI